MGFLSILPASFVVVETWITRLSLFLGLVLIGPWLALVVYDLFLYIFRAITYEIPVIGGRARGKARPRAPTLTERPDGHRRRFSLARRPEEPAHSTGGSQSEGSDARLRHITEKDGDSSST
ncbi:hypothetical protein P153DRAFT_281827 [Dothidotthia symphoricarpi CBS 119687]|uniref:Uncharacterized protein n=1 Tax=Dothidotthia symphoricarpi CBS 119687 TaxID=1392245 RepID=A0A6A6AQA9_9PLEO|nr:uncharacterized protein P153DRAFT_281827 [Dothidotthia symphoricarpi CBS 119687]KAF2133348.1 hypothetical protein P153DRAFT_281827 [Dothidotthia symphoricarpi CBS 119687]